MNRTIRPLPGGDFEVGSPASFVPTGYVPRQPALSGFAVMSPQPKAPPRRLIHDEAINRALDEYEAMRRDAASWRALRAESKVPA